MSILEKFSNKVSDQPLTIPAFMAFHLAMRLDDLANLSEYIRAGEKVSTDHILQVLHRIASSKQRLDIASSFRNELSLIN